MLQGKKVLLCLSGGIAVYKSVEIASLLVKAGAIVKTVMTEASMEFITPLTLKSITKESVSYKLFNPDAPIEHISLADWADIIVIAPATANIIGKIANGIADDLLSTTIMAASCPVLIIPAMNVHMYENVITQKNIEKLISYGYHFLKPDTGRLACGYVGMGKMPDPVEIIYAIKSSLFFKKDFSNKKVLITAGASVERIDPMRHISNVSSGRMGLALVRAAYLRGADVSFIHSFMMEKSPYYIKSIEALSAKEMHNEVMKIASEYDIIIMCAAVADYTPVNVSMQKIKKSEDMQISLTRTVDILSELGKIKSQFLVGFAAESENLIEYARLKINKKNIDMIVANNLTNAGKENSEITILKSSSDLVKTHQGDKFFLSNKILDEILDV